MKRKNAGLYERIDALNRISRGFQGAIVLAAAVDVDLFTLLGQEGPLEPEELAAKLRLDPRAAGVFLRALAGMGLLAAEKGKFHNGPLADELLVRGKDYYQGDIVAHSGNLIRRWIELPGVLRTGKPARRPKSAEDRKLRRNFILGMSNIAGLSAESLAAGLDLESTRYMLDLGGGPGTYAITFCRLHPSLRAVVFDLPEVIDELTDSQVRKAGLADRISLIRGDYLADSYGSGYDLILVSNIIHSLGAKQIAGLFGRCREAAGPGARIVVKDFFLNQDRVNPPFASMFAVNMLVGTESGGCYTVDEVRGFLEQAGFTGPELAGLTPQTRFLVARCPAN